MNIKSILIGLALTSLVIVLLIKSTTKKNNNAASTAIERFKRNLKSRSHIQSKAKESLSNQLMSDPENNISINKYDDEVILREKADIHRTRLQKFGRSKLNGEVLFLSPNGGVYKETNNGEKRYV